MAIDYEEVAKKEHLTELEVEVRWAGGSQGGRDGRPLAG
jgi:hypothetical protein